MWILFLLSVTLIILTIAMFRVPLRGERERR